MRDLMLNHPTTVDVNLASVMNSYRDDFVSNYDADDVGRPFFDRAKETMEAVASKKRTDYYRPLLDALYSAATKNGVTLPPEFADNAKMFLWNKLADFTVDMFENGDQFWLENEFSDNESYVLKNGNTIVATFNNLSAISAEGMPPQGQENIKLAISILNKEAVRDDGVVAELPEGTTKSWGISTLPHDRNLYIIGGSTNENIIIATINPQYQKLLGTLTDRIASLTPKSYKI